jgi:hypothetical protein
MIIVSTYDIQPSLELNHFFVAEALLRVSISALRSLIGSHRSTWVIDLNLQDRTDLLEQPEQPMDGCYSDQNQHQYTVHSSLVL